jgi:hypothetical protein
MMMVIDATRNSTLGRIKRSLAISITATSHQRRRALYVLGYRHTQTFANGMQISSDVTAIYHFLSLAANGKCATVWGKEWERSAAMAVIGRGTHGVGDLLLVQLEHRNVDLIMADSGADGDSNLFVCYALTIGKYLRAFRGECRLETSMT